MPKYLIPVKFFEECLVSLHGDADADSDDGGGGDNVATALLRTHINHS